jgi:predicted TPR repeat methyltransferase
MNKQNKQYWNTVNIDYKKAWETHSQVWMSQKELEFINKFLGDKKNTVLDIGVGIGRILDFYTKNEKVEEIYGVDISEEMLKICNERFPNNKKIKELKLMDVADQDLDFKKKFDLISAIRILKYNKNWKENIGKLKESLNEDGVLVFTMSNTRSINIFAKTDNPFYRSTKTELLEVLKNQGMEALEINSFTRIPDIFYTVSNNKFYSNIVIGLEKLLSLVLGKVFLGRILFVAAKKVK